MLNQREFLNAPTSLIGPRNFRHQGASTTVVSSGHFEDSCSAAFNSRGGSAGTSPVKLYLFGGRLVSTRRMVNDLYALNLETLVWEKIEAQSDDGQLSLPQPRYFHSCDVWKGKLIVFGGMGHSPQGEATDGGDKADSLCVLDQVIAFDLTTQQWEMNFVRQPATAAEAPDGSSSRPVARYAHLSSVTGDALVIIGGQNVANQYVDQIHVFDLTRRFWQSSTNFQRQCGSYRSLAVSSALVVEQGQHSDELVNALSRSRYRSASNRSAATVDGTESLSESFGNLSSTLGGSSRGLGRSRVNSVSKTSLSEGRDDHAAVRKSIQNLQLLPMSRVTTKQEQPPLIYIYSNYNFTDVKRELETAKVLRKPGGQRQVELEDQSAKMAGPTLPPGLRFPTGVLVGDHLIVSGTYLANTTQAFSVWALHVPSMSWARLDAGPALQSGSWNRAVLWAEANQLVILGNRERDLVTDYNHRQTNWEQVLLLDLDTWGINQPPLRPMSDVAIAAGLQKLNASLSTSRCARSVSVDAGVEGERFVLPEPPPLVAPRIWSSTHQPGRADATEPLQTIPGAFGSAGDFEIVCSDGMHLACDRAVLEARWPWFREKLRRYQQQAKAAADLVLARRSPDSSGSPTNGVCTPRSARARLNASLQDTTAQISSLAASGYASPVGGISYELPITSVDCRFIPRQLELSEPSPVVLALLQFFYTQCICTPLQRHPSIIASLLILSKIYALEDGLGVWARHAALSSLNNELSPGIAVPDQQASSEGRQKDWTTSSVHTSEDAKHQVDPLERHRLAVTLCEAAGLASYESLQLRALRTVVALSKHIQHCSSAAQSHSESSTGSATNTGADQSASQIFPPAQKQKDGNPLLPAVATSLSPLSLSMDSWDSEKGLSGQNLDAAGPTKAARLLGLSQSKVERRLGIGAEQARLGQMMGRASPLTVGGEVGNGRPGGGRANAGVLLSQLFPTGATAGNALLRPEGTRLASLGKKRFSIFGRSSAGANIPENNASDGGLTQIVNGGSDMIEDLQPVQTQQHQQTQSVWPFGGEMIPQASIAYAPAEGATSAGGLPPPTLSVKEIKRLEKLEKKRAEVLAKASAKMPQSIIADSANVNKSMSSISPTSSTANGAGGSVRSGSRTGISPSGGETPSVKSSPTPLPGFFHMGP